MRKRPVLLLLMLLMVISEILIAQDFTLAEANKLFRRRDYTTALLVIEEVVQQDEYSKNPDAWLFLMKINDQLMSESRSYADSVLYTEEFVKAYTSCISVDTINRVSQSARNLMRRKSLYFKHKAEFEAQQNKTDEYVKAQKMYIYCQKATGKPSEQAVLELARAYSEINQTDLALEHYMALTGANYNTENIVSETMVMLRQANRHDTADSVFALVLEQFPNNVSFRLIEIKDLMNRELYFKARNAINEILPENDSNAELHYVLGHSNMKLNLADDGITELERAIELQPNHYDANFETGKYYLSEGVATGNKEMLNQSKQRLEKCEIINPNDLQLLAHLRDLYLEIRDLENYQRINDKLDN